VVDKDPSPDLRTGVNFNARKPTVEESNKPGKPA
jgi:hypothetical protein